MTIEQLADLLIQFMQADTWAVSKQMVLDNPVLLSNEAQQMLGMLAESNKENAGATLMIQEHQQLLAECRIYSVEVAFTSKIHPIVTDELFQNLFLELSSLLHQSPQPLTFLQQMMEAMEINIPSTGNELLQILQTLEQPANLSQMSQRIELCQQALNIIDKNYQPELWASLKRTLANSYTQSPEHNRRKNIELAIEHFQDTLSVYTYEIFPQEWAMTQNNLGNAYLYRINGDMADNIEIAIHYHLRALSVIKLDEFPEKWATIQNNLALAYTKRIQDEYSNNLEKAIFHYNNALSVYTREVSPHDWAMVQHNLSSVYLHRINGHTANNIEMAIDYSKNALSVYSYKKSPCDWASSHHSLAQAYLKRIEGELLNNIEQAISHFNDALSVYTREIYPQNWALIQNDLGLAYIRRMKGRKYDNLELAIQYNRNALVIHTQEAFPIEYRQSQRNLAQLYWQENQWGEAQIALKAIIDVGQDLFTTAYTETGRQAQLTVTATLYTRSVYCLTQLGEYAHAFTQIEQGKTRLLSEALSLSEANLGHLQASEKETLFQYRDRVRALEAEIRLPPGMPSRRPTQTLTDMLRTEREQLNQFVEQMRSRYPNFRPQGLPLPEMLTLIPQDGALVAPFLTEQGGGVFILPDGITAMTQDHFLPLPDLTTDALDGLLIGTESAPGWLLYYLNSRSNQGREDWFQAIPTFTQKLWQQVVAPIHEHLTQFGLAEGAPLVILPQGRLGLLPLHAAWREVDGQPKAWLDEYTIQYGSSGYALRTSQRRAVARNGTTPSLLGLINPTEDLPTTPFEGQLVSELFDTRQVVSGREVTADVLTQQTPHYQYLHFSGHGFYNWKDVMQSGLVLGQGKRFTLTDILTKLNLRQTRLVTLSACETGITDIQQTPDEFIGLPTALMQAGAGAVVSTLWAVADFATTLLISEFYRAHLQEKMPLPVALRHAQQWTRNLTNAEVANYAKGYHKQDKDNPMLLQIHLRAQYRLKNNGAEARPFSNPFYWAAFTYYGASARSST